MTTVSPRALAMLVTLSTMSTPDPDGTPPQQIQYLLELAIAGFVIVNQAKSLALTDRGKLVVQRMLQAAEDAQRQGRE